MASIKDVAEMAGVSLSTASIVANGKSKERKISEATQKKVLETMKTLKRSGGESHRSMSLRCSGTLTSEAL